MKTHNYRFVPSFPDEEAIRQTQLEGLRWTLRQARNSPQYRAKLDALGVQPEDIKSLEDWRALPLTTADDLRQGYPLPLLCVPEQELVRVHASSGTTGKRKILAYSRNDVARFGLQMARCYELAGLGSADRIQVAVGYGLWTAGAGFQAGSELLGALTIPVGPGNLDIHLQLLEDLGSTCFCATASMALLLAEEVERSGLIDRLKLRKLIFGSEACSPKMRQRFESALRLESSHDIGGMTEMYGPGSSIECEAHEGLHYWPDLFYLEVVDPVSLQAVPEGQSGELVVTSLCKEAVPLLRYRTHDLSRLLPGTCSCGLCLPRHDAICARSDDMFVVRGVNIYPGQIMDVLGAFTELDGEYHITLLRREGRELMQVAVERRRDTQIDDEAGLAARIEDQLQRKLLVRGQVSLVAQGSLPRTFSKSKRVSDLRQ